MSSFAMKSVKMETSGSPSSRGNFETRETEGTSSAWSNTLSSCVMIADLANHLLIGALTGFTLYHSLIPLSSKDITSRVIMQYLHYVFCTVGYVLLMSEAIVIFTGLAHPHRTKRNFHLVVQILGVICVIIGILLMVPLKKRHFQSTHAILGLTSLVLMLLPFLTAFRVRRQWVRPIVTKFFHNFFGLSSFAIGMASQCYGYRYFPRIIKSSEDFSSVYIGITVVIAILSARRALANIVSQFVSMFR